MLLCFPGPDPYVVCLLPLVDSLKMAANTPCLLALELARVQLASQLDSTAEYIASSRRVQRYL